MKLKSGVISTAALHLELLGKYSTSNKQCGGGRLRNSQWPWELATAMATARQPTVKMAKY